MACWDGCGHRNPLPAKGSAYAAHAAYVLHTRRTPTMPRMQCGIGVWGDKCGKDSILACAALLWEHIELITEALMRFG